MSDLRRRIDAGIGGAQAPGPQVAAVAPPAALGVRPRQVAVRLDEAEGVARVESTDAANGTRTDPPTP
jgi:hypothetical protein